MKKENVNRARLNAYNDCRPKNPILDDPSLPSVFFSDQQLSYLFPEICVFCRNENIACTCVLDEEKKDD